MENETVKFTDPDHIFIEFDFCSGGLWADFSDGPGFGIDNAWSNYGISERLGKAIENWNDTFDYMLCWHKDHKYTVRQEIAEAMKPTGLLLAKYLREEIKKEIKVSFCHYYTGDGPTYQNTREFIEIKKEVEG
jgi:hypothetical protein